MQETIADLKINSQANITDNKNNNLLSFRLTSHTTQEQHQKSCQICRHSKKEEIEGILCNPMSSGHTYASFSKEYGIGDRYTVARCIKKHIEIMGLQAEIEKNTRLHMYDMQWAVNAEDATVANRLELLEKENKILGVYQDAAQPVDIQILQQLVGAMIPTTSIPKPMPLDTNNIDTPLLSTLQVDNNIDTDTDNAK